MVQALAQALAPFVKLSYIPGTAATNSVAAAAQQGLAELDLSTTIQLMRALACVQALPGKLWNAIMGHIVDLLSPFADLAGKAPCLAGILCCSAAVQKGHASRHHLHSRQT